MRASLRAAAGLAARLVPLFVLAGLSGCVVAGGPAPLQGYVEGNYVSVAAEEGGKIAALLVTRGQRIAAGDILFRLSDAEQTAGVAEARARVAQAEAQLANLQSGKRPEEIAVLDAQVTQAHSALTAALADFQRATDLFATHVVAQAQVDSARERRDTAAAQVAAAERQVDAARLSARPDEIMAAQTNLAAVRAALDTAQVHFGRRTVAANVSGTIEDVYFDAGESIPAAQPVVSILPDNARKIRFYLPEPLLGALRAGDRVALSCDACAAGLTAEVTFIASQPEYTPPVIYSKENRAKLVFRIEARPLDKAAELTVGLPVDVRLQPTQRVAVQP